jgi:hypothetical protein
MKTFISFCIILFLYPFSGLAQAQNKLKFSVREVGSFDMLSNVSCFVKQDTIVVKQFRSDAAGEVNMVLPDDQKYRIIFIYPGYESKKFDMDMRDYRGITVDMDVEMVPTSWLLFRGAFHDKDADKFLKLTKIKIRNLYTGETSYDHTNEEGLLYYYMKPKQKYEYTTMSGYHINRRCVVNTDCGEGDEIKFCLSGFNFENFVDPDFSPKTIIGTVMLDSIRINKMYAFDILYDMGSANIRSDAVPVLDQILNLLKDNPGISIELGSHTDSRGSHETNQKLSEMRAESAVGYLTSRGISQSRLSAKGYGETQLRNECGDGVSCSEEKHQQNRRTEIRITKFTETELK